MTKFLIKWKAESFYPPSKEERLKLWVSMAESTKADLDTGLMKDWGISVGSGEGYVIAEGSETEVWETCVKYRPYVRFEVTPVISIDQYLATIKKMAEKAQVK
jgi:hypothetical protein